MPVAVLGITKCLLHSRNLLVVINRTALLHSSLQAHVPKQKRYRALGQSHGASEVFAHARLSVRTRAWRREKQLPDTVCSSQ